MCHDCDIYLVAGNEFWTVLAADKRTVAVQPFKITQNNQWISIQPNQ